MQQRSAGPSSPVAFVQVRTPQVVQRTAPPAMWVPGAALASAFGVAAVAGVVLGILAALRIGIGRGDWLATVQAHAAVQLWGWCAVLVVALIFEFVVRLNRHPMLPVAPRIAALSLLMLGALLGAAGRVAGVAEQPLAVGGAMLLAAGAVLAGVLIARVPAVRPFHMDWHPLFFRAGLACVVLAAALELVAALRMRAGVTAPAEVDAIAETFLRGFAMNVVVAVGLRAFPSHLGLPEVPVRRQRVLFALLNGSLVLWLAGTAGFGLPGLEALRAGGDLLLVAALAWATSAFGIVRGVRALRRTSERPQFMVSASWAGLVVYAALLAFEAVAALLGTAPSLMGTGAVRHTFMLGFLAPLFLAMSHVVLERFGTGHVLSRDWLTAAFVLVVLAWPLRVVPPLLDPATGAPARGLMGVAGALTAIALLVAAAVAARNALAAARFMRQFRRPS